MTHDEKEAITETLKEFIKKDQECKPRNQEEERIAAMVRFRTNCIVEKIAYSLLCNNPQEFNTKQFIKDCQP